jgi:hypothetical protein
MTMDPLLAGALERLEKALKGRPLSGYTEVLAGDVILVATMIPQSAQTSAVKDLETGAANNKASQEIWQSTERLAHLVALAKG